MVVRTGIEPGSGTHQQVLSLPLYHRFGSGRHTVDKRLFFPCTWLISSSPQHLMFCYLATPPRPRPFPAPGANPACVLGSLTLEGENTQLAFPGESSSWKVKARGKHAESCVAMVMGEGSEPLCWVPIRNQVLQHWMCITGL